MAAPAESLGIPAKTRSLSGAGSSHLSAESAGIPTVPQQPAGGSAQPRGNEVDRRTLIIGQGISLAGEVASCDRLIVEGAIEAKLQTCQHVIIAETGVFNGTALTENADVRGRFEGELVVRKRLLIRAGGRVSGTITYGEIEIESGGEISGAVEKAGAGDAISSYLSRSA